jgi:hypothetical protein
LGARVNQSSKSKTKPRSHVKEPVCLSSVFEISPNAADHKAPAAILLALSSSSSAPQLQQTCHPS